MENKFETLGSQEESAAINQMHALRDQYREELNKPEPDEEKIAAIMDQALKQSKTIEAVSTRKLPKMTMDDRAKLLQAIDGFSEKEKKRFEMLESRYLDEMDTADPDELKKITLETAMLFGDGFDAEGIA